MFTLSDPVVGKQEVEWRKMGDHLFGFQDPGDLETSRAGAPSICLISPNNTLRGNESYRISMPCNKLGVKDGWWAGTLTPSLVNDSSQIRLEACESSSHFSVLQSL